ncbi:MAG TPA: ABC transporter, partial [Treponemataceae bacterium]|nr:ABC transporter [Treponemataceae bacterium]
MRKQPVWIHLAKRELAAFYSGPVAYIVAALFLAFSGFLFFSTFFLINRAELRNFFSMLPILFAFFIPALTMRLFSEEMRSGSLETLMTLPVTPLDAVA